MTAPGLTPGPIAMGTLYLDKNESLEYLEEQARRYADQNPSVYFLEIVCRPDQVEEAMEIQKKAYAIVKNVLTGVKSEMIFLSITPHEAVRLALITAAIMTRGLDPTLIDTLPKREARG